MHVGQAGHRAAIDADEVRMLGRVVVPFAAHFVAPHMIAELRASDEAAFGQVHQVAIHGRPIEARRHEFFRQFGVRERSLRGP